MSSTCRRYDSLSVSARLVDVSVLPSPGFALVTMTMLRALDDLRVVQRRRQPPELLGEHRGAPGAATMRPSTSGLKPLEERQPAVRPMLGAGRDGRRQRGSRAALAVLLATEGPW